MPDDEADDDETADDDEYAAAADDDGAESSSSRGRFGFGGMCLRHSPGLSVADWHRRRFLRRGGPLFGL